MGEDVSTGTTERLTLDAGRWAGLRALVAVEEPGDRDAISAILTDHGLSVAQASGFEAALAAIEDEPISIVVTELGASDAADMLLRTTVAHPDVVFVALVPRDDAQTAAFALRAGAFDCLGRPVLDEILGRTVLRRAIHVAGLVRDNQRLLHSFKRNTGEMAELNSVLRALATRDGLTGLFNHRYFQEALRAEIDRSRRHKHEVSLLFLDIDYFKQYNDTHGHTAGDNLLTTFGKEIDSQSRSSTIVARYGGEEFVVIAPETNNAGARIYAEKLRRHVESYPFPGRESQPTGNLTISVGVATFPEHGEESKSLVAYADQALYRAKRGGRNAVRG